MFPLRGTVVLTLPLLRAKIRPRDGRVREGQAFQSRPLGREDASDVSAETETLPHRQCAWVRPLGSSAARIQVQRESLRSTGDDERRNSFKSSEEHFNATVTVRQQAGGIGKVVRLGSNLYRHHRLLLRSTLKEFKYSTALAVSLGKNHLRLTRSRYHAGYRRSQSRHILRGIGGSIALHRAAYPFLDFREDRRCSDSLLASFPVRCFAFSFSCAC